MDFYIFNYLSKSKCHFTQHYSQIWNLSPNQSYSEMLSQNKVVKQLIRGKGSACFCPSFSIHHVNRLWDKANVWRWQHHCLNTGQQTFSICLINRVTPALQSCSVPRPKAKGMKRRTEEGDFGENETGLILKLKMVLGCFLIWRR